MSSSSNFERMQITSNSRIDKWSLVFAFIGLVYGAFVAIASGYYGFLVLVAIAGVIALVIVVLKPDLGIALLLIVLFAQVQRAFAEVNGWPGPGKPLVLFMLGVVILRFFLFNERPAGWIQNVFILVLYAISLLVSVITADNVDIALEEFLNIFENLLIVALILFVIQRSSSIRNAIWAVIIAGIFMASISVFQNLTKTFDNNYFGFGGWEYSGYVGRPRMTGPYETPNPYAQILCVIFILALDRSWHEKRKILQIFALVCAGVIALALIYTDSRGGFLSFAFTIFVFFLFNRPSISTIFTVGALGIFLLQFLPANYTERILTLTQLVGDNSAALTDESFRGRTSENIAAWRMFLDNPVFGVGLENYSQYYLDYSRQIGLDPRRESRDPASLYLELLANRGLVGTAVYIGIIIVVFIRLYKARQELLLMEMQDDAYIASALFAALAGYMFMSIYKNSAYTNAFWSLMALCMAVTQIVVNVQNDRKAYNPFGDVN